jgi:hypothetical protein
MCLSHLLPFVTDSPFQWLLLLVAFASIMMMKMKMMKEEAIFVSIAEGNLNNIYMKKKVMEASKHIWWHIVIQIVSQFFRCCCGAMIALIILFPYFPPIYKLDAPYQHLASHRVRTAVPYWDCNYIWRLSIVCVCA